MSDTEILQQSPGRLVVILVPTAASAISTTILGEVHQPYDKMFMRMPRKAMFHILRMDNFDEIRGRRSGTREPISPMT